MVAFEEHFWGEKHNGFDVLQQNFKLGLNASKEIADFLKERSSIEEAYSRSLLKLASKCAAANSNVGSFDPCWRFLQSSTEKLANVHSQIIQNLNEISKFVKEYGDKQKEAQKTLKDDCSVMSELVLNLQNLSAGLQKAKEAYEQRASETDRSRKELSSLKDIKHAETRFEKSCKEYKLVIEKREAARSAFQEKMQEISMKFQAVEEEHLQQMLDILSKYGEALKGERFLLDQIIEEFGCNMLALTVDSLLQQFVNTKQTGKVLPVAINFEEIALASKPVDVDAIAASMKEDKKRRKAEKKERRQEKLERLKLRKDKTQTNGGVGQSQVDGELEIPGHQIDEEGYVIRPPDSDSIHSNQLSKGSYSSDSDSDSDDDEPRKLQVHIKPKGDAEVSDAGSTEQLKALSAALTLHSPGTAARRLHGATEDKKHMSAWGSLGSLNKMAAKSRSNNDLLSVDKEESKSPDTASLHSLPLNATYPNFADSFATKFTSPPTSPTSSSPADFNALQDWRLSSISQSSTFDTADELGTSSENSAEISSTDVAPPPVPVKKRTSSLRHQFSDILMPSSGDPPLTRTTSLAKKKTSLSGVPGELPPDLPRRRERLLSTKVSKPVAEPVPVPAAAPVAAPVAIFSNDLFASATSAPATMEQPPGKAFANFDAFSSEASNDEEVFTKVASVPERDSSDSKATAWSAVNSSARSTSVLPWPKTATILPPPSVPNRRSHTQKVANHAPLTRLSATPPPADTQSSLSDLLDINFASTEVALPPSSSCPNLQGEDWRLTLPVIASSTSPPQMQTLSESSEQPSADQQLASMRGESERQVSSPPALPRRDSTSSQAWRMQPPVVNAAAGPLNVVDRAIPIAVAFIETVNAVFRGADAQSAVVKVTGDMTLSFPANIISILSASAQPPLLSFIVTGTSSLEQIFPNKSLVERGGQLPGGEGMTFKFNMAALAAYLKRQSESSASASYYNIDILKYQVRCQGSLSAPLQLQCYWRCDEQQTDLKLEYKYNSSATVSPATLSNVSVVVPVDGGVTIMQSKPTAIWSSEHQRCMWKLTTVSNKVENQGAGTLRARFEVTHGPTTPAPVAVQFSGEGSTISQLNFDLISPAYKLSLVKKRFASGKYVIE